MPKKGEKLSPETIEKMRAAKRAHWQRPGFRESVSQGVSQAWDKPGRREEFTAKRKGYHHTPEAVEKIRRNHHHHTAASNPEYAAALSESMKRRWQDEEYRAKVLERVRDPEVKARVDTPESRRLKSEARKREWAQLTPEERSRRIRRWSSSGAAAVAKASVSSIERLVQTVLDEDDVEYLAQASLGWYHIDFLIPSLHLCLECDGDYWHSLPRQVAADAKRDSWLRRHGYRVARLSESVIRADARTAVREALALASSG